VLVEELPAEFFLMASPAQCFYCFECLSASFTGAEPPKLSLVEDLWEEFEASKELALDAADGELEDEAEAKDGDGLEAQQPGAGQLEDGVARQNAETRLEPLKLPSIGRLQAPSLSSRSSTSSTPSALSTSSSRSALTSATTTPPSPRSTSLLSQAKLIHRARYPKSSSDTEYPLFVTWNTVSRSGNKALRGCIGTFEAQALDAGLKSYALTSYVNSFAKVPSDHTPCTLGNERKRKYPLTKILLFARAFGDTRFSPIPVTLLPSLSCSLTLLSSFETCSHALDWELGIHGIRISFTHRGRRYGATYLPDVAVEQGWTKEQTLDSLMRKAGWEEYGRGGGGGGISRRILRGAISTTNTPPWEEVSDFKTVRYQGLKASASYAEWQEWRKWVASTTTGHAAWLGM
jgi:AMMECR1 domain-containing protein